MRSGEYIVELTVTDNQGATSTDTVVMTVAANGATPTIDSFSAIPASITASESATLSWTTTGADSVSINGGARFTVTLTNTGSSSIAGAQLSFNVTPNSLLKNVSPGSSVAVGNLAPASSVSQTWNVRGDNEGSGNITAAASSEAVTLDTVIHSLTVIK